MFDLSFSRDVTTYIQNRVTFIGLHEFKRKTYIYIYTKNTTSSIRLCCFTTKKINQCEMSSDGIIFVGTINKKPSEHSSRMLNVTFSSDDEQTCIKYFACYIFFYDSSNKVKTVRGEKTIFLRRQKSSPPVVYTFGTLKRLNFHASRTVSVTRGGGRACEFYTGRVDVCLSVVLTTGRRVYVWRRERENDRHVVLIIPRRKTSPAPGKRSRVRTLNGNIKSRADVRRTGAATDDTAAVTPLRCVFTSAVDTVVLGPLRLPAADVSVGFPIISEKHIKTRAVRSTGTGGNNESVPAAEKPHLLRKRRKNPESCCARSVVSYVRPDR